MANTYLSPEVVITEVDKSQYTTTFGVSTGAGVLVSNTGSVGVPILIDSETTLVNVFGQPNDRNYKNWLSIANFLQYTNSCWVVRMETKNQFNANSKGLTGYENQTITNSKGEEVTVYDENGDPVQTRKGLVINNNDVYTTEYADGNQHVFGEFASRFPGALGNSIMVTYADAKTYDSWIYTDENGNVFDWRQEFNQAPNTSSYARTRESQNDELHLLVVDMGGKITGTKGTVLEKFSFLSKSADARSADGLASNYKQVLKDQSDYVYCMDYPEDSELVSDYSYRIQDIVTDDQAIKDLIDGAEEGTYDKGDLFVTTDDKSVKVLTYQYQIDDDGIRRRVLIPSEHASLEAWTGKNVLNIADEKVYSVNDDLDLVEVEATTDGNWGVRCDNVHFKSMTKPVYSRLGGGADDFDYTDGDEMRAWDVMLNKEAYDFGLAITGACNASVAKYVIQNICEVRMDCVAFVSPCIDGEHGSSPIIGKLTDEDTLDGITSSELKILNETIKFREKASFNVTSSYGHLDSGWKYMYDKYNDCNRWVPLNGDCAGLYAQTDSSTNQWTSAAGYLRGQIRNVIKLNYSPNKVHRDQLYPKQINPVVTFAGDGTILYGSKSLQAKPSAFDRLNVRRLFIYIEKALADTAKYLLFENNTASLRQYATSVFEPVLRNIQGAGGIYNYSIVCNDSNNTADVVDSNKMIADIYIAPTRVTDFINLNFICTGSGQSTYTES